MEAGVPTRPSYSSEKKDDGVRIHVDGTHEVELERRFSFLSCLGLAFSLLNSWTAMSASLPLGLPSGGSVAMIWGLVVSAIGSLCMGLSLAEICHVFPMSGGQYDFTYCIATPSTKRGLSFFVGWMMTAGWTALFAAACSLGAGFVTSIVFLWNETFVLERWHTFLMYLGFVIVAFLLNTFGVRILPHLDRFGGTWGMLGIVTVSIVLLACSSGKYQPAKLVFTQFTNETGWPNGIAFILGLLQSTLGLTAFDAATHMAEEMPKPGRYVPRIMVIAIGLGAITSWIFMVILLFSLRDFDAIIVSPVGALLEIYHQSTGNRAGATCLIMFNLISMFVCIQAVMTVASRVTLAFSRDRGLGAPSHYLTPVHPTLLVPVWSIVHVTVWVTVFGLIYLGSSVALNAILSASILFLQTSYGVPILIMFVRGDKAFAGHNRTFNLGKWRPLVNGVALAFNILTSVCFIFPPALPVSGTTMNYAVVVLAVVLIMCSVTWLIDGRKNFNGPTDLEERLHAAKNA